MTPGGYHGVCVSSGINGTATVVGGLSGLMDTDDLFTELIEEVTSGNPSTRISQPNLSGAVIYRVVDSDRTPVL